MATQIFMGTLEIIECYKCHVHFGMTQDHTARCKRDGDSFYCPNGHSQCYTETDLSRAKSEAAKARQEAAQAKKDADTYYKWYKEQSEIKAATERRLSATRGAHTRLKNSIAAGKCPCCGKNVIQLEAHMRTKHPDFTKEDDTESGS